MKHFIALNKQKDIISLIFIGGEPIVIKNNYSEVSKRKCVYYTEFELKRIKFPEEVTFEEIDTNVYGGCKLIPKAEEEKEELNLFLNKVYSDNKNYFDNQILSSLDLKNIKNGIKGFLKTNDGKKDNK